VLAAERQQIGLPAPSSTPKDAGVRELVKRSGLLKQENEVLRRVTGYFSQAHLSK
jgi:hypothetical protein